MTMSHNKKRNTAFLFEVLLKEQTKAILDKKDSKAQFIEKIIKQFFSPSSILYRELELYNALLEFRNKSDVDIERIIQLTRNERGTLNDKEIYEEQSKLIGLINKKLSPEVFYNFVPNYKELATINILFSKQTPFNTKLKMEENLKVHLKTAIPQEEFIAEKVDTLILKKCVENFNEKYEELLDEQKELLEKYLLSKFGDNIDFPLYLNAECKRLSESIEQSREKVKDDRELYENINKVLINLKTSSVKYTDDLFIYSILKNQQLARELAND